MMILYDIHTHKIKPDTISIKGCEVRSVLNLSLDNYMPQKDKPDNIWFSCGIHPWHAENSLARLEHLQKIVDDDKVVAIGEAGLDKVKGPDIQVQIEVFKAQVRLAMSVQKPLIIHCVKAWDELIALHKEFKSDIPWIIHGYRGNPDQTKQLVKQGFKFSIGEKFNPDSLPCIPLDSIFCETDESDIPICKVYEAVSICLGLNVEQFVGFVGRNIGCYLKNISK